MTTSAWKLPHSLRLARRQVIALNTIHSCQVDEVGRFFPSYRVEAKMVILPRIFQQSLVLEDLVNPQAFADALVETVCQDQEQQQSVSGAPEDNIVATDNLL
jgi:hypothetical protein